MRNKVYMYGGIQKMSTVGAIGQGPISQFVAISKQTAEEVITSQIKEVTQDPAKIVRELQQPSPFSQFLDIKI
jgi:hypothetical protein